MFQYNLTTMKSLITSFCFFLFIFNQAVAQTLIKVPVKANKLVYDSKRNLLYASASPQDSIYGNQLVAINATTGQIVNTLFVGSEPDALAITFDKDHIFIGMNGATIVVKVNLISFTVESQINLGSDSFFGGYFPYSLATVNNSDDIVIVSREWQGTSPANAGIVVYQGQTKLSLGTTYTDYSFDIQYDSKNNMLYGYDSQTTGSALTTYSIDTLLGITPTDTLVVNLGVGMKYANNYLFGLSKVVVDLMANPPYQSGTFSYSNSVWGSAFAVDDSAKTYYISETSGNNNVTVASFNPSTYLLRNTVTYSNTVPNSSNFQAIGMTAIDTASYAIIVQDTYNESFGNPAGWYVLLKANLVMGIKENVSIPDNIYVYPNPVSNNLTIAQNIGVAKNGDNTIYVRDVSGREILRMASNLETSASINMQEFDSGVYFVTIENNSTNQSCVKKIIKN